MASRLKRTFTTTVYVDFELGNDANTGLTPAQALRTLARVVALFFTPVAVGTEISVLVIVAGSSGGSNTVADGLDQFTFDTTAPARSADTSVGFRNWTAADGARPGAGGPYRRPLFGSDKPCAGAPGMTLIGAGATYRIDTALTGNPATISMVLFKPRVISQINADGCSMCHLKLIGQGTDAEATIDTNLTAAGAGTAYYKTDTFKLYINTTGLTGGTTGTNYSWCAQQTIENFSKIRPNHFTYVGVEGCDFLYGERGAVVFDARVSEAYDCRFYENAVHNAVWSYSDYAVQDITIDGCEFWGLGSSSVGNTMLGTAGGSGNFDVQRVRITNCKWKRYMLLSPAGINYNRTFSGTWANREYPIFFLGIGTAPFAPCGQVLNGGVDIVGCTFEDISPATTSTISAGLGSFIRHTAPSNPAIFSTYPVRFDRCHIKTYGSWFESSAGANYGGVALGFNNCKIFTTVASNAYTWGVRTAIIYSQPVDAGKTIYHGVFGNTEWTIDWGKGDAGNNVAGWGCQNVGTAGLGIRSVFTARNSKLSMVYRGPQSAPLFDQNTTVVAADKNLKVDVQNCLLASVFPVGMSLNGGQLAQRDLPAVGNVNRIFANNRYIGFNEANFTQANTTLANFILNVDPLASLNEEMPWVTPDYTPALTVGGGDRAGR